MSSAQEEEGLGTRRDAIQAVVPAHQGPGELPTELPYKEHGHQENLSYQTQLRSTVTPHGQSSTVSRERGAVRQPGMERSKDIGKAESPSKTEVFVSMAMAVVSATDTHEETTYDLHINP